MIKNETVTFNRQILLSLGGLKLRQEEYRLLLLLSYEMNKYNLISSQSQKTLAAKIELSQQSFSRSLKILKQLDIVRTIKSKQKNQSLTYMVNPNLIVRDFNQKKLKEFYEQI